MENRNKGIPLAGPHVVKCSPHPGHPKLLNEAGLHPHNLKEEANHPIGICLLAPPLILPLCQVCWNLGTQSTTQLLSIQDND